MSRKKILIIAIDPWRDDSNGGNVFSNLFWGWENEYEFAEIYFRSQLPHNSICNRYYQLSETQMIKDVWRGKSVGRSLQEKELSDFTFEENRDSYKNPLLAKVKNMHLNIVTTAINVLWHFAKWRTDELDQFIDDFNPDYIFAPLNNSPFKLRIDRYVAQRTGKKIISYVSDDHLSLRQRSWSPVYWLNRLCVRRAAIKTAKYYSMLYTMTDEQLDEYTRLLQVPMKILRKGNIFDTFKESIQTQAPYTIVYGGNLLYGRISTIKELVKNIAEVNRVHGKMFELNIYTATPLDDNDMQELNDGMNSKVLGRVTQQELNIAYSQASIALHVDSFELRQRLATRLSFSTKIIDLLHTGCCVMAICWSESSPYKYLTKEDAAICVDRPDKIKVTLESIILKPTILHDYARKAWDCGAKNHDIVKIQQGLKEDFKKLE